MKIQNIRTIIHLCEDLADGDTTSSVLAIALEEPLERLEVLLKFNEILDQNGDPTPYITGQDVLNVITLCYAMQTLHKFEVTVMQPKKLTGARRAPNLTQAKRPTI